MSQTMMAFLAMMIAALAAINQYTAQVQSYDAAYKAEFELMANALVLEEMEIIDMTTDFEDLEDWNGDEITRSYEVWNGDVEFTVAIAVQYVDESGEPSEVATSQKEVTVSAQHPRYTATLVSHSRIIAE
jgi:hypothetical protein